jgi:hypothetical protein
MSEMKVHQDIHTHLQHVEMKVHQGIHIHLQHVEMRAHQDTHIHLPHAEMRAHQGIHIHLQRAVKLPQEEQEEWPACQAWEAHLKVVHLQRHQVAHLRPRPVVLQDPHPALAVPPLQSKSDKISRTSPLSPPSSYHTNPLLTDLYSVVLAKAEPEEPVAARAAESLALAAVGSALS